MSGIPEIGDRSGNRGTLLMSGATGMVGAYVMAQWLRAGRPLAVVARGKGTLSAAERIDRILERFETAWSVRLGRPRVFQGDLNQPGLGLLAANAQWIATNCNQILHSAANLSFAPARESVDNEPYRTNVDGTRHVIDFCREFSISQFHHVSTAYVCGQRSGTVSESEGDVGQSFANDYERSKIQAEEMLGAALRSGTLSSLTIYRPSIVIDRTGLSPISGDRTIYGAFSMYQMLASRFGLPDHGEWFRNLGFVGSEQKNIVDVDWIANAIRTIISDARHHNHTYHLTSSSGTTVRDLDAAFRTATQSWLSRPTRAARAQSRRPAKLDAVEQAELDRMAAPFVNTFLPYFRDDPQFGRDQIDRVIAVTDLPPTPEIRTDELLEMVQHWSAFGAGKTITMPVKPTIELALTASAAASIPVVPETLANPDEVVICGYEVRLPGGVNNAADFADLLWAGRSGIAAMPADRLDRALYFDTERNVPGKTYTQLGGCVLPVPLSADREQRITALGDFDLTHRQFAQVAMAAMASTFGVDRIDDVAGLDPLRAGVLVGHSGGTQSGGPLAMSTLSSATAELIEQTDLIDELDRKKVDRFKADMTAAIRQGRPSWQGDNSPNFNAYSAASLTASLIGSRGRREVIDAACSSSLLALQHAVSAIHADHLDVAVVGGATFNNVDNLALFSQSGACSVEGCYPFDRRASGLISSEGYVAVILVRRSVAERLQLPIHAAVTGVGVASDGKGKGLWAPRSEGQQLAIRRVSSDPAVCLDVDYLECHATSTQVGDATELDTLTALLGRRTSGRHQLPIGSVKSNLGHLLEAAGLVGMVKCLIAMRQGELPPSIHFEHANETYDWTDSPIRVVAAREPWPDRKRIRPSLSSPKPPRPDAPSTRIAGISAFGIGGLNAHAVIRQSGSSGQLSRPNSHKPQASEPIAIVGRGLVLPGASNIAEFAKLLQSSESRISDPPAGRWPLRSRHQGWVGVEHAAAAGADYDGRVPHCRGAYIHDFQFDAQGYRIPPKTVRYANPAQLMLIQAAAQAIEEFDGKTWSIDRTRVGVVVGTIFGGEFSNSLQIGLRLPEIREHFLRIARREGLSREAAETIVNQFHECVLQRYPALLDETGGFTASTLASRITRTFDLMGGACAVDADEASGGLAMLTAMEQLRARQVDAVLCGMTHRSMDLVAFEQLYRRNQLVHSGRAEDVPNDGSRIFPGEGVAIMMLQRLSDAVAQNKPIFGVLEHAAEGWTDDVTQARADDARQSATDPETSARRLISKLGHLGGGQGIVRVLAATVSFEHSLAASPVQHICETARDGYQVQYQIAKQPTSTPMIRATNAVPTRRSENRTATANAGDARMAKSEPLPMRATTPEKDREILQIRLRSGDSAMLQRDLRLLAEHTDSHLPAIAALESAVDSFDAAHAVTNSRNTGDNIEIAIVGRGAPEIAAAAVAILDGPLPQRLTTALPKHLAWIRCGKSSGNRVAWLFPGQGSQYPAVPRLFSATDSGAAASQAALSFLQDVDNHLKQRGMEPVSDRLADPKRQLGRDVWWTQLWVLAVGAAMTDSLVQRGHRPDVVLGHSFGECTAAWAAGVMDMDQAIEFAKCRSDAVIMTRQVGGELLSVRGEPSAVQAVIDRHQLVTVISHHNSPMSTVIAGEKQDIAAAKSHLADAGMAAVVINVPAAFHTPAMKPAQDLLRARFGGQHLLPPRVGFLSAVSNRYLAEPTEIMDNLINQLTQPVCFNGALQRIVAEGCGFLIEVGPDNVLTRLANATVDGRAICLSADDRRRDHRLQQMLIEMACESFHGSGLTNPCRREPLSFSNPSSSASTRSNAQLDSLPHLADAFASKCQETRFDVVDVTSKRRRSAPLAAMATAAGTAAPAASAGVSKSNAVPNPASKLTLTGDADTSGQRSTSTADDPVLNRQAARDFLFDLAVDLTGYDPDIIDFEADLEAELGVDSIKKAQLIGEMVQWSNTPIDVQSLQLAQFETLHDILGIVGEGAGHEHASPALATLTDRSEESHRGAADSHSPPLAADTADAGDDQWCSDDSLRRLMIDLVVDQTGYDESIIDMDADMEGELGIDSIKKAQLLGELVQQYDLESVRDSGFTLADFATLESIRAFVWEQITATGRKGQPADCVAAISSQKKNELEPDVTERVITEPVPAAGTHRFLLGMRPDSRLANMPATPIWNGPALVLGKNRISNAIVARWHADAQSSQYPIVVLDSSISATELETRLDEVWADGVSPHLFITTPHDAAATWRTTDAAAWHSRREAALTNPFRLCQRWMHSLIEGDRMSNGSLATVVQSGGNFHFGAAESASAESGGLSGLTKAMLIEAWMRGYRETPMLIIDTPTDANASAVAEGIWRELATPSYDEEVAVSGQQRFVTTAHYTPLPAPNSTSPTTLSPLTPGGNWIIAGGGRGITAMTAMELAARHNLKLHLLGTAPVPQIDDSIRRQAAADRLALRRQIMHEIQSQGGNPVTTWQKFEKAIEIDQTLQACRARSIDAVYHCVDVSDVEAVNELLGQIRQTHGPIRGVIHGAGAGQDARFDRKRPDKVEKCFQAKIDGCIALANATRHDPLEWFVGFGSISGRFGANGHTDYSAANDMLAKLIANLQQERPETRCVTFHWHAWGDVGMATKPEAKLALDMIGMEFMPAQEGLQHFIRELECGGNATEVLITDRRYVRKFFPRGEGGSILPVGTQSLEQPGTLRRMPLPMLDPESVLASHMDGSPRTAYTVTLHPTRDRFLSEHLVQGRPTLPFVMAIEMLAEAAHAVSGQQVIALHEVQAHSALKCLTLDPLSVEILLTNDHRDTPEKTSLAMHRWTLVSDLRRCDGRLVEAARPHFSATVETADQLSPAPPPSEIHVEDQLRRSEPSGYNVDRRLRPSKASTSETCHPAAHHAGELDVSMQTVEYQPIGAPVYHGPQLQCLRKIGFTADSKTAVGWIVAPSPAHLAGEDRPLQGWIISPASMDAVLYAAGMLAYRVGGRASLPISFKQIDIGRLPLPGESLRVIVTCEHSDARGASLRACLTGMNGDNILTLIGYEIGWFG